jgi:hypothetical protein
MRRIEASFPETGPTMIGLAYLGLTNGPEPALNSGKPHGKRQQDLGREQRTTTSAAPMRHWRVVTHQAAAEVRQQVGEADFEGRGRAA